LISPSVTETRTRG